MKIYKIFLALVIASSFIISGCGEKGDTGDPGQQGPPGNANVLTITFDINSNQWLASPSGIGNEGYFLYYLISIPEITQEMIDYGAVIAYYNDNGFYLPLPYVKYYKETVPTQYLWEETLDMVLSTGTCQINYKSSDFYAPEGANQTVSIKLVLVDGLVRLQNSDLDWNNYNLVKERLNLKD